MTAPASGFARSDCCRAEDSSSEKYVLALVVELGREVVGAPRLVHPFGRFLGNGLEVAMTLTSPRTSTVTAAFIADD